MNPPERDVQRKLVSRAFTPRAIAEHEPFVRKTAVDYEIDCKRDAST